MFVIYGNQSCITDFYFVYSSFASILLCDNNIIPNLKWFEDQKHDPACNICKTALQCKTYRYTGSTKQCRNRGFLYTKMSGNAKYQQNVKYDSQQRSCKLDHTFVYRRTLHGLLYERNKPLDHFAPAHKYQQCHYYFQPQFRQSRKIV